MLRQKVLQNDSMIDSSSTGKKRQRQLQKQRKYLSHITIVVVVVCCVGSLPLLYNDKDNFGVESELVNINKTPRTDTQKEETKFISYKIVRNESWRSYILQNLYAPYVGPCRAPEYKLTQSFKQPGVIDFHALIDTNLRILYIGDSVAMQHAQMLQEASKVNARKVVRSLAKGQGHGELAHVARTDYNGIVAALRINHFFMEKGKDLPDPKQHPPNFGPGWFSRDVQVLSEMCHEWNDNLTSLPDPFESKENTIQGNFSFGNKDELFDVLVYQLSPGWWMNKNKEQESIQFLKENFHDSIQFGFSFTKVKTIIVQTIPVMNNVGSLSEAKEMNAFIIKYARDFNLNQTKAGDNDAYRRILVLDLYAYTVHLFLQNSLDIGKFPREEGKNLQRKLFNCESYDDFLVEATAMENLMNDTKNCYLGGCRRKGFVCADSNCKTKSAITKDGMHHCNSQVGGRINTATACLLKCRYSGDGKVNDIHSLTECEMKCNKLYMSLDVVDWKDARPIFMNWQAIDLLSRKNITRSVDSVAYSFEN